MSSSPPARAQATHQRGLRASRGLPFIVLYLPFLAAVRPWSDALCPCSRFYEQQRRIRRLAQLHQDGHDFRLCPPSSTSSSTRPSGSSFCCVFVVALALLLHGRANRVTSSFRFLFYIPGALAGAAAVLVWLFMLDPSVSPYGSFLENVLGTHLLRPVDRARAPALHVRNDRLLDRSWGLDRRHVRGTEHDPARA